MRAVQAAVDVRVRPNCTLCVTKIHRLFILYAKSWPYTDQYSARDWTHFDQYMAIPAQQNMIVRSFEFC